MEWLRQRFELSRGGADRNLPAMEGLRGVAVVLVFLVHYVSLGAPWLPEGHGSWPLAQALMDAGHTGVDLFFVLSGCLIYGAVMAKPRAFAPFFARRLRRLYPAFAAVFFLYLGLSFVFPAESKIPDGPGAASLWLMANFLMLPGIVPIDPMITVAWSLSYEVLYYLTIPLLVSGLGLRGWRPARRVVLFLAIAAGLLIAGTAWQGFPVRLAMFTAGIVLWECLEALRLDPPSATSGAVAALAALAVAALLPWPGAEPVRVGTQCLGFFVLCLAAFGNPRAWLARVLAFTPLRWLGNMSYSYYLLHGLALKAAFLVLGRVWPPAGAADPLLFWGGVAPLFALTLLPTAVLFLAVERPLSLATAR